MTSPAAALAAMRSRNYLLLLLLAGVVGVVVSAAAYGFLWLVGKVQQLAYSSLPHALGFHGSPSWWSAPVLLVAGVVVALTVRSLPGRGGRSPLAGFAPGETPSPVQLPSILLAAVASLSLGAVVGPEMPLIALGAGLGVGAVRLARSDAPPQLITVVAAAGSFAAISALLGSPLLGAFLLLEASGLAGATLELVLVPGLLAAGIGSLIFIGLDAWTGLGTFSLALPSLTHFGHPDVAQFAWALGIGVAAALLGSAIRRLAGSVQPLVSRHVLWLTPAAGVAVAALAIGYAHATAHSASDVLFSGESSLGPLVSHNAAYSVGALLLLLGGKSVAYSLSMGAFRGGPTFPGMFLGAAGGIAMSHLPGLPLVPAIAMGIGGMSVVMLKLPLTSVLLATLLLSADGLGVMPLVIVAVVVAYVTSLWLNPPPTSAPEAPPLPAPRERPAAESGPPPVSSSAR